MTTRTQRGRSPRGEGGSRPSRPDRSAYSLPPSPVCHTARKTISPSFLSASSSTSRLGIRPDSRTIAMMAIPDPDNNEMNDRSDSRRDSARGGKGRRHTHTYLQDADVSSPSCTDQRQHHQQQRQQQQHQQQHRGRDSSESQDPPSAGLGDGLSDNSQYSQSQSMTIGGRRSRSIGRCDGRGNARPISYPSQCRHPSNKNEEDGRRRGSTSRTRRNVDDRHRRRSVSCPRGYIEKERRGSPTRRNDRQRSKSRPKSRPRPPPPPAPPRRLSLDYSVPSSRADIVMSGISSDDEKVSHSRSRNNSSRDHDVRRRHDNARRKTHDSVSSSSSTSINSSPHQHHQEQQQNQGQQRQQQKHQINLVIDSNGHGQFHIKSSSSSPSQLTFKVQIDEASRRFLIHSSMGRLDKIRELHPGMNILRTLSHWNELQKRSRRLRVGDPDIRGGMLGIAPEQIKNSRGRTTKADMIKMTLMGEYAQHAWENDVVFQKELERFVEDALQFNFCLNGGGVGGDGVNESCQVVGEVGEAGDGGGGGEIETAARKGNSGLLGRVLQKVIGD